MVFLYFLKKKFGCHCFYPKEKALFSFVTNPFIKTIQVNKYLVIFQIISNNSSEILLDNYFKPLFLYSHSLNFTSNCVLFCLFVFCQIIFLSETHYILRSILLIFSFFPYKISLLSLHINTKIDLFAHPHQTMTWHTHTYARFTPTRAPISTQFIIPFSINFLNKIPFDCHRFELFCGAKY